MISYVAIKVAQGRAREIGAFMWALTGIFFVHFAVSPMESRMGVH